MRAHLRIVAGELRGRKVEYTLNPNLRPTPDMVREALFSILGNAVPERPFFDVFAGTGVIGLEALSRGASVTHFVERDFRNSAEIARHLKEFEIAERGVLARTDVYRWAERWQAPAEAVNVFFSPPFIDYQRRPEEFLVMLRHVMDKVAPESVLVVQSERDALTQWQDFFADWDQRGYGRNELLIWVKGAESAEVAPDAES